MAPYDHPDRQAFVAAVRADPDDDTPRMVAADWLDENGDPDRAEFIRAQVHTERRVSDTGGRLPDGRPRCLTPVCDHGDDDTLCAPGTGVPRGVIDARPRSSGPRSSRADTAPPPRTRFPRP